MSTAGAQLRMTAEVFQLAKNNHDRIEDCHFIFHAPDGRGATTIGVADGVGGCREKGIDPGEYSEELMLNALAAVIESGDAAVDPIRVLKEAHSRTAKPGSSTACIITLAAGDGELRFANVGDSGFKVLRRNAVAYESPIQQSRFNCPFQLYQAGEDRKLVEECAVEGRVKVEAGDVVVAGTDGLFDNLYGSEIERILVEERVHNKGKPMMELARVIALTAFRNS
ncbi:unnamed protein product [Linum trigynum]|uniref:Protein phosphatase n=1 Tax=Linum trigynum TaxID=586398 RepID=A0AAV2G271_9ROSI